MRKALVMTAGLVFALACSDSVTEPAADTLAPSFDKGGIPADGNGNKDVSPIEGGPFEIECNGESIWLDVSGWAQFKEFGPPNNRHTDLGVFHIVLTYTNADGDTFVWPDVGPDRSYTVDGEDFVAISGRSTASGNIDRTDINVGHVVLNLTTGEVVHVAGRGLGPVDELACDALT